MVISISINIQIRLLAEISFPYISYQLYVILVKPARVAIGQFGIYDFPAGQYVYTGSAKRNIEARIARHLCHDKKLKWHIDYLLASPHASVNKVMRFVQAECELNQSTAGIVLIAGFGASDCRAGCGSHLKYL
jgi:Uri superfamily endonuclease